MSRQIRKSIKINKSTHSKIVSIATSSDMKIQDVLDEIVSRFIDNGFDIKNKEPDEKENEMFNKIFFSIEERLKKVIIERTNTSIGFIKTLDRKLVDTRRDIMFKIDPDDDTISHPLEHNYNLVFKNLLLLLKLSGINEEDLVPKLRDYISKDELDFFINSYNTIMTKRIN